VSEFAHDSVMLRDVRLLERAFRSDPTRARRSRTRGCAIAAKRSERSVSRRSAVAQHVDEIRDCWMRIAS
jgi:hypothetical protein